MINNNSIEKSKIDWILVMLYFLLVIFGWVTILSATAVTGGDLISHKVMMQALWIGISLVIGFLVIIIDSRYYYSLSYLFYIVMLLILLMTIFVGVEVNGAKSWIALGSVRIQPAEFGKLATALAVARYMNNYRFNIKNRVSLFMLGVIMALPVLLILLQNDTGSALVYGSFLFMLYNEGLSRVVYLCIFGLIIIFILSFFLAPFALASLILISTTFFVAYIYNSWKRNLRYIISVYFLFGILYFILAYFSVDFSATNLLLLIAGASIPFLFVYSYRNNLVKMAMSLVVMVASFFIFFTVGYAFENIMQIHQQKRILDLLGIESDVAGWGYNVNQSKIAIGSGGFWGKGFLDGTQTKYNFVPEHSTDFIFCTIGEEFGFVGSMIVIILFLAFISRLIFLANKQEDTFNRVFTLCVASIFLFHLLVNVGMTIGLMPVIGIPLPFFSYGGSSLLSFTLLTFIAIKLTMETR